MKSLIAIFLCYLLPNMAVQAVVNFEDTYGIPANGHYSAIADQVVIVRLEAPGLSLRQKTTRLKNLQARINEKLQQFPNDPLIWFLSGLNQNSLAEVQYLIVLNKSSQQEASADNEVLNYNISRSRAYGNAIRFDSKQPHQLSSSIYATMGHGLSNRQKIKTYSRELTLGNPAENESNEWFMRWANIDVLVQEKKLDKAQLALTELKNLLQKNDKALSPFSSIVDRAESLVLKAINTSEKRNSSTGKKSKPLPNKIEQVDQSWGWKTWLLISIGFFIFSSILSAAIYFRRGDDFEIT